MYHRDSAGSISYAEFRHLGKEGVLGRYSLHFHLVGDTMRGSYVIGASIWDSDNRWLTIHGTNYLVVRDNVGYKSVGHGFFLEDGTEVYNVLDRNLAVGAQRGKRLPKQVLPLRRQRRRRLLVGQQPQHLHPQRRRRERRTTASATRRRQRSALKLDLPDPAARRQQEDASISARCRSSASTTTKSTRSTGLYGVNLGEGVNRVGPDAKHPFIVRNLKIWNAHYGFRPQVPSLLVENLTLHRHALRRLPPQLRQPRLSQRDHQRRRTPSRSTAATTTSACSTATLTVDGLTFDNCRSGGMPLIQISDDNPTGTAVSHFRNVKTVNWNDNSKAKALVNLGGGPRPTPKTEKGVPIYLHDWFGAGKPREGVSIKSGEFKADPTKFRDESPLTGNESRVAEVKGDRVPASCSTRWTTCRRPRSSRTCASKATASCSCAARRPTTAPSSASSSTARTRRL